MPNRLIKETIHTSERVNAMTDFEFRLWVSLITYVDDYGRGDARPAIIKGICFPLREDLTNKDVEDALIGLAGLGCIVFYDADDQHLFYFPHWDEHQRIRSKRSKFPAPVSNLQTYDSNSRSYDSNLQQNAPVIQSNPNPIQSNPNPNPIQSESKSNLNPIGETAWAAFDRKYGGRHG